MKKPKPKKLYIEVCMAGGLSREECEIAYEERIRAYNKKQKEYESARIFNEEWSKQLEKERNEHLSKLLSGTKKEDYGDLVISDIEKRNFLGEDGFKKAIERIEHALGELCMSVYKNAYDVERLLLRLGYSGVPYISRGGRLDTECEIDLDNPLIEQNKEELLRLYNIIFCPICERCGVQYDIISYKKYIDAKDIHLYKFLCASCWKSDCGYLLSKDLIEKFNK